LAWVGTIKQRACLAGLVQPGGEPIGVAVQALRGDDADLGLAL